MSTKTQALFTKYIRTTMFEQFTHSFYILWWSLYWRNMPPTDSDPTDCDCLICWNHVSPRTKSTKLLCDHIFCKSCIHKWFTKNGREHKCPYCMAGARPKKGWESFVATFGPTIIYCAFLNIVCFYSKSIKALNNHAN
jgi:hypothetical protein